MRSQLKQHCGLWVLLIAFVGVFLIPSTVKAQQQISLRITPVLIELGGQAGEKVTTSFEITNTSDFFVPVRLSARQIERESEVIMPSAISWIDFNEPDVILRPRAERTVNISISIPQDAGPGGYYAEIIIRALTLEAENRITTAVTELAIPFFVTVQGEIVENHQVVSKNPGWLFAKSGNEVPIKYEISNNGNVHSIFTPTVTITRNNQVVDRLAQNSVVVLPNETIESEFMIPDNLSSGIYSFGLDYTYGTENFRVDKNSSTLLISPVSWAYLWLLPIGIMLFIIVKFRDRIKRAVIILRTGK